MQMKLIFEHIFLKFGLRSHGNISGLLTRGCKVHFE